MCAVVAIQLADNPTPCVFQVKGNENVHSQTIPWDQIDGVQSIKIYLEYAARNDKETRMCQIVKSNGYSVGDSAWRLSEISECK